MNGRDALNTLRRLCRDLDANRPPTPIAWRRSVATLAAPVVLGLSAGTLDCATSTPEPSAPPRGSEAAPAVEPAEVPGSDDAATRDAGALPPIPADAESTSPPTPEPPAVDAPPLDETNPPRPGEPPRIRRGEATVVYGAPFPREVVQRVVRNARRDFQACMTGPVEGRVVIAFTIEQDGSVSSARAESSTLGDPALDACLAAVFTRQTFPRPQAGVVHVRYPLVFRSQDE